MRNAGLTRLIAQLDSFESYVSEINNLQILSTSMRRKFRSLQYTERRRSYVSSNTSRTWFQGSQHVSDRTLSRMKKFVDDISSSTYTVKRCKNSGDISIYSVR